MNEKSIIIHPIFIKHFDSKYSPIKNRAAYSIGIFLANTVISQLIMYGIVIKMAAFLRPILSAKMPDGTAPTIAPIANSDAIHVFSWTLVGIMELGDISWSCTGDVHDRPVPAAAALRQTVYQIEQKRDENEKKKQIIIVDYRCLWCKSSNIFFFFCLRFIIVYTHSFFLLKMYFSSLVGNREWNTLHKSRFIISFQWPFVSFIGVHTPIKFSKNTSEKQ